MIKKFFIVILIASAGIIFSGFPILAYEPNPTHRLLTQKAAQLYNGFSGEEIGWLTQGAEEEDTPPRWINHFYDPKTGRGWDAQRLGQTEQATLQQITKYGLAPEKIVSAPEWGQNAIYQTRYSFYGGNQTFDRAVYEYFVNKNKKAAFIALGHVLHLIEDMTVPAHTRQDTHADIPFSGDNGDPYEQWTARFNNIDNLDFSQRLFCQDLNDCFNQVARYTQENFFSKDTIRDQFYNTPIADYPRNLDDKKFYFKKDYFGDYPLYFEKNGKLFIDNENIQSAYFQRLAPKAVAGGIEVIRLFFERVKLADEFPVAPIVKQPPLQFSALTAPFLSPIGTVLNFFNAGKSFLSSAASLTVSVFYPSSSNVPPSQVTPPVFAFTAVPIPAVISTPKPALVLATPNFKPSSTPMPVSSPKIVFPPTPKPEILGWQAAPTPIASPINPSITPILPSASATPIPSATPVFEPTSTSFATASPTPILTTDPSPTPVPILLGGPGIPFVNDFSGLIPYNGGYLWVAATPLPAPELVAVESTPEPSLEPTPIITPTPEPSSTPESSSTPEPTPTPDLIPPEPPVVTSHHNNQIVNQENLTLRGTAESDSIVFIEYQGSQAMATASAESQWQKEILLDAEKTEHQIILWAQDQAGNQSATTSLILILQLPNPSAENNPNPHLVISEIQISGQTADDEFVELYNPTAADINLSNFELKRAANSGKEYPLASVNNLQGKVIKSKGYLLIASAQYSNSVVPDVTYPVSYKLAKDNSLILRDSEGKIVDKVGWGKAIVYETAPYSDNPEANQSLERKAFATSTAESLIGGEHKNQGNGYDSDDNQEDFILRLTSDPQNSQSPIEPPPPPPPPPPSPGFSFTENFNSLNLGSLDGQGGWIPYSVFDSFSVQNTLTYEGSQAIEYSAGPLGAALMEHEVNFNIDRDFYIAMRADDVNAVPQVWDMHNIEGVSRCLFRFSADGYIQKCYAPWKGGGANRYEDIQAYNVNQWYVINYQYKVYDAASRIRVYDGNHWSDWSSWSLTGGGNWYGEGNTLMLYAIGGHHSYFDFISDVFPPPMRN